MSPLKRSNNIAARMGRWSASHRKSAILGWLAFVVLAVVIGGSLPKTELSNAEMMTGEPAQARVELPWPDLAGRTWALADRLDGRRFERSGDALAAEGLYVGLDPWGSHFLAFAQTSA